MSAEQKVERLQALLETVQRNRQRPGEPIGEGASTAAASVVQNKAPANMTDVTRTAAEMPRARSLAQPQAPSSPMAAPSAAAAPPPPPTARREPPAPRTQPRIPEPAPAPVAQEPIVPRMIEPDPPRDATRPIAQLVSKHAPVVDATFGAMLKRSLSLRPH